MAVAQADDSRLQVRQEALEQTLGRDRLAARGLAQARHGIGQFGRELGARPINVRADADDDEWVRGTGTHALAEDAGHLPKPATRGIARSVARGNFEDDVIGPLELQHADGQPGQVLGGVDHGQGHDCGQPPGAIGRQVARPETK